jgi:hypothetical protein
VPQLVFLLPGDGKVSIFVLDFHMALFYVSLLSRASPVNRVLAILTVVTVPIGGNRCYVLAAPAEEDADWLGQASEHCLLTD